MNNTTTRTLPLFAIFVTAALIVAGTSVAIQPANAIDKSHSESTSTICIDDMPCITKICINNEPCNNTLTSSPTNTNHNLTNNNNNKDHTLFSLFPQENK
jgi:hypothetical protein